jgi:geranylgeranyl diphosphate synthase type II
MIAPRDASEFDAHLEHRRRRIEAVLETSLPGPPACPPLLHDALRYSLIAGGKRMRPVLTLLAAEAISHDPAVVALAEPAACAVELIHTYSLIHDDLPAMDNDTLRRGRPTSHVVFGEGLAILAGDGLLTEAFGLLAREPRAGAPERDARKVRAIEILAAAAGACGMVGGQAIDLAAAGQIRRGAEDSKLILDAEGLAEMHARKTGALIRAAAVAGAIMAGGSETQVQAIGRYATALGLAFQIVDDILDVEGADSELGKTAGKDAAAGKPTYPALYGLAGARHRACEARDRAVNALAAADLHDRDPLAALAHWVVARTR